MHFFRAYLVQAVSLTGYRYVMRLSWICLFLLTMHYPLCVWATMGGCPALHCHLLEACFLLVVALSLNWQCYICWYLFLCSGCCSGIAMEQLFVDLWSGLAFHNVLDVYSPWLNSSHFASVQIWFRTHCDRHHMCLVTMCVARGNGTTCLCEYDNWLCQLKPSLGLLIVARPQQTWEAQSCWVQRQLSCLLLVAVVNCGLVVR